MEKSRQKEPLLRVIHSNFQEINGSIIGGDAGAANEADRAYKGQIAVARIYDRALTAEEVKLLYDTLEE